MIYFIDCTKNSHRVRNYFRQGKPGAGKTTHLLDVINKYLAFPDWLLATNLVFAPGRSDQYERIFYINDIKELVKFVLSDIERPKLVAIDEGESWFDCEFYKERNDIFKPLFGQHRKLRIDMYITCFDFNELDVFLRRICHFVIRPVKRFSLFDRVNFYDFFTYTPTEQKVLTENNIVSRFLSIVFWWHYKKFDSFALTSFFNSERVQKVLAEVTPIDLQRLRFDHYFKKGFDELLKTEDQCQKAGVLFKLLPFLRSKPRG